MTEVFVFCPACEGAEENELAEVEGHGSHCSSNRKWQRVRNTKNGNVVVMSCNVICNVFSFGTPTFTPL